MDGRADGIDLAYGFLLYRSSESISRDGSMKRIDSDGWIDQANRYLNRSSKSMSVDLSIKQIDISINRSIEQIDIDIDRANRSLLDRSIHRLMTGIWSLTKCGKRE
jgi:hypothetical protein